MHRTTNLSKTTMIQFSVVVAGFAAIIFFLSYYHRRRCCRDPLFTEWPLLGMLPPLLFNLWRFHDHITAALQRQAGTGNFTGPWFTQMNCIMTCDPMNANHIMRKNFADYVKGPEFRKIFKLFGDTVLTADSDAWKHQRAFYHPITKSLEKLQQKIVRKKVETCLVPVLDHLESQGADVDLQDLFSRLTFDVSCSTVLGSDPKSLAIDFPELESERAFDKAEEIIFYRHMVPRIIWKLQRWLRLGAEKKMAEAFEPFERFLRETIASRRAEITLENKTKKEDHADDDDDLLTTLIMKGEEDMDDKYLRDTAFSFFIGGKGPITSALTWFFWLVATHPPVEAKILQEMKQTENEVMKKQVYLHAALCEALRLYPPVPYVRRKPIKHDILPSGHEVVPRTVIILCLYAMGRSEEIWGKDCLEFKPERWISERGDVMKVASYKFMSFIAGPRTCLGKDVAFIQLKIIATAILSNYHVHVVEDHPVSHTLSIQLQMKYGLKVRITRRG